MRQPYSHYVIAVPAAKRAQANAAAQSLDRESVDVFSVPLSSDGGTTLTHYGCCAALRPDTAAATVALSAQLGGAQAACVPGGEPSPEAAFAGLGLVAFVVDED